MIGRRSTDLFQIDSPAALLDEVIDMLHSVWPSIQTDAIGNTFKAVNDLYAGQFPGYCACNTGYHDLSHANTTFLAMARLINGAVLDNRQFSENDVVAALAAALVHDAGYIQKAGDLIGTGAKFKTDHEQRSVVFLNRHGAEFGLSPDQVDAARTMISCTDMEKGISTISFPSHQIELLAKLLASADLLAQLSDATYLEKLLFLFYEFREAGVDNYKSESDILKNSLTFYDVFEDRLNLLKIEPDRLMELHFAAWSNIDENPYRQAINGHKHYLVKILNTDGSDPFHQLRRGGIVETIQRQFGKGEGD